jgi:putative membrane protein
MTLPNLLVTLNHYGSARGFAVAMITFRPKEVIHIAALSRPATLLLAAAPLSQIQAQAGRTPPNDRVSADAKLIRGAAADNLLEVQLGELAQHQATNPTVQKFGQRMVNDHGKLEKQWTDLAANHGMPLKAALSSKKQKKIDNLRQASGAAFDREYTITMIKAHAKDVAEQASMS